MSFYLLNTFVSSTIRGDLEVGFYSSVSIYFFIKSRIFLNKKITNKKTIILFFLSGITIGLSFMVKELALIFLIFYFLLFVFDTIKKKEIQWFYSLIIFGFITVLILQSAYLYSKTGNFLQRFEKGFMWYTDAYEHGGYESDLTISEWYLPCLLFDINTDFCQKITRSGNWNNTYTTFGTFFYFVFISMIYVIIKGDKKSYIFIFWVLIVLFYMEFGSMGIYHYISFHKEPRYLTIISIPSLILISRFLFFILERKTTTSKIIVFLIIILLLVSSLNILKNYHSEYIKYTHFNREIYEFLKDKTEKNIWAEYFLAQYLELKFNYKHPSIIHNFYGEEGFGYLDDMNFIDCNKDNSNSYIIFTKEFPSFYKRIFPNKECLWDPLVKWEVAKKFEDESGHRGIIYYIP